MRVVGVVKGEVIIYRPLCGGCAVRGADMRAKVRGGSRRGDVPYGGRYARRARGNGLYGDLAGGERRGVWQGGYARYRAIITLARRKSMQRDNNDQIFSKENDFFFFKIYLSLS